MRIAVHEAEVKTATVEIRTLTISGKQVTLAVFRQLVEESLIGEDGKFRGLPWGTVNYHPDKKECPSRDHRHVVWQSGDELRRATVQIHDGTYAPWTDRLTRAAVGEILLSGGFWVNRYPRYSLVGIKTHAGIVRCDIPLSDREAYPVERINEHNQGKCFRMPGQKPDDPCSRDHSDDLSVCQKLRDEFDGDVIAALGDDLRAWNALHSEFMKRWAEVQALPQLFIAV